MKALIIGSGFKSRNDLDILCDKEWFLLMESNGTKWEFIKSDSLGEHYVSRNIYRLPVEISFSDDKNHSINLILNIYQSFGFYYHSLKDMPVCDNYINCLLKLSHKYKRDTLCFEKTRKFLIQSMKDYGSKYFEFIKKDPIFKKRCQETYDYEKYKLNVSKKEFFTDNVNYLYDHDSIHEAIKLFDKPCYEYAKEDKNEVFLSRKLFNDLDMEKRLGCVLEESYVLALERHQIPNKFKPNPKLSFKMALEKICTSITSGWFRDFAWENYDNVIQKYNENYVMKFKDALKEGKIKNHGRNI